MDDYEKISRGNVAARMLSEPLFEEIIQTIREDAIQSLTTDLSGRHVEYIAMIRALDEFRQNLQSIVTTGKNAANKQV